MRRRWRRPALTPLNTRRLRPESNVRIRFAIDASRRRFRYPCAYEQLRYVFPMDIMDAALPEIKVVMPRRIGNTRGFFSEVWNARDFAAVGMDATFVQGNHVRNPQ